MLQDLSKIWMPKSVCKKKRERGIETKIYSYDKKKD